MKNLKKITIIGSMISLFAMALYLQMDHPLVHAKEVAPSFELKSVDGTTHSLSSFQGKKVILHFWAAWCSACKSEIPELQAFYEQKNEDTIFLSINSDPDYPFEKLVKENGITYPILLDKNSKLANKYRILTVPTTFIVDEEGFIVQIHYGPITKEGLNKLIE